MMVSVDGLNDPEQSAIIERLVRYCLEYYFPGETSDFKIAVEGDMTLFNIGRFADCSVLDTTCGSPKSFLIRLVPNGVSFMDRLRLTAHEMVHVKQFHSNEFDVKVEGRVFRWQGKTVDIDTVPNWCEPWEIEARGMEKAHVEEFCEMYNLRGSYWYKQCV